MKNRRLVGLFVAHLLLAAVAPLASVLLPSRRQLVGGLVLSIPISQLMLLAFWYGFVNHRGIRNVAMLLAAIAYAALLWHVALAITQTDFQRIVQVIAAYAVVFALLLVPMIIMRVNVAELRWLAEPHALDATSSWRFSIRGLLAITLAAALYLGAALHAGPVEPWSPFLPSAVLGLAALMAVFISLVWATLWPGSVWRRILVAIGVTTYLAVTLSVSLHPSTITAAVLDVLALLASVTLVIASLLVVRSCGYRLIPHRQVVGQALCA